MSVCITDIVSVALRSFAFVVFYSACVYSACYLLASDFDLHRSTYLSLHTKPAKCLPKSDILLILAITTPLFYLSPSVLTAAP